MKSKNIAHRLSALALVVLCGVTANVAFQRTSAIEPTSIRIEAGQTLEIASDPLSKKTQYNWILTKDRKFVAAQRTMFFQARLAEAGTYVLDVSMQDPQTNTNEYRAFTLVVTEPSETLPDDALATEGTLSALIVTDPGATSGNIGLPAEGGMVRIDASKSTGNISRYKMDLDTSVDSDGNGDPSDDFDNQGTISEKSGTPVYVYFLPKIGARSIRLQTTELSNPVPAEATVNISFTGLVQASSSSIGTSGTTQGSAIVMQREGLTVRYAAALTQAQTEGKQLLYEWDFGDRSRSLLDTPIHTYVTAGTYTVTLSVHDISNGEMLYSGTDTVIIDAGSVTTSSQSSSISGTASSMSSSLQSSSATSGTTKSSLGAIFKVVLIIGFLLAIAVGLFILFTWLKRKTTVSIQQTFEKMEGSIVKKDGVAIRDESEPMKLKREPAKAPSTDREAEIVVEREKSKTEFTSQTRTNETPSTASAPVPPWLAKANAPKTEAVPSTPVSAPKPASNPESPKSTEPLPKPSSATPATEQPTAPVPDWLKPKAPTAAPEKESAEPKPAPKPVQPSKIATESPKVAPIQPKPEPKNKATTPAPNPPAAPKAGAQAPAPKSAPSPAAPVQPPAKTVAAVPEAKKEPPKAPEAKPVTAAPGAAQPKPVAESIAPAANQPIPKNVLPKVQEAPAAEKPDDTEPTIAIISADSLQK